jgi:hypothetical protein
MLHSQVHSPDWAGSGPLKQTSAQFKLDGPPVNRLSYAIQSREEILPATGCQLHPVLQGLSVLLSKKTSLDKHLAV